MLYAIIGLSALLLLVAALCIYLRRENIATARLYEEQSKQLGILNAIYKSMPDMVFCKDANGRYTSCTSQFEELTGYSEAELIGKSATDVYKYDSEMAQYFIDTDNEVLSGRSIVRKNEWFNYTDGSRRLYDTVRSPIVHNDEIIGTVAIARDVMDRHKMMLDLEAAVLEANSANMAKSSFLARMSHELRTPMNAIMGMTELALRGDGGDDTREYLVTVKQASENLLAIINDILDFSKIESGTLTINPIEYMFSSLLNDVISIIRMKALDSQIRFAVNVDSNIPNSLFGDEIRIRQIMINILGNAVKYTDKGFVSLTVRAEQSEEGYVSLVMEVTDSGKGLKPEDLENVFQEHIRVDAEINRDVEGTGLGLAISNALVNAMGGSISVESEYGKGSTFTIVVPQKVSASDKLAVVKDAEIINVLIYERREIYAKSIADSLGNLGVRFQVAYNELEIYKLLVERNYTFIFVPYAFLKLKSSVLEKLPPDMKIILYTDFGEAISDKKYRTLIMPVHAVSIANALNGEEGSLSFDESSEIVARFSAPDTKILVVDDIGTNLKVVEGLLLPYSFQTDLCKSGAEAIKMVRGKRYDLVFMDHKMPKMDGVEAMTRIRDLAKTENDAYYTEVPIIALTANAISGTREMLLDSGFNDYLSKPIDTVKLNAALEKWIPKGKRKRISADGREHESDGAGGSGGTV